MSDLDISDQVLMLLLQRVPEGKITNAYGDVYHDDGRLIWPMIGPALGALAETGSLRLGQHGPDRMRPVSLTERGLEAAAALRRRVGLPLESKVGRAAADFGR